MRYSSSWPTLSLAVDSASCKRFVLPGKSFVTPFLFQGPALSSFLGAYPVSNRQERLSIVEELTDSVAGVCHIVGRKTVIRWEECDLVRERFSLQDGGGQL